MEYNFQKYANDDRLANMSYKELFLSNYERFDLIVKKALDRENNSSKEDRKKIETAIINSGLINNEFDSKKFIEGLSDLEDKDYYYPICANILPRFEKLYNNIKLSFNNKENEVDVINNINEINYYISKVGTMFNLIENINVSNNKDYTNIIKTIINNNKLLKNKKFSLITAGFTNTIYLVDEYVVRICTKEKNEDRFKNEICFYQKNIKNIPKLYHSDTTKSLVPYMYEVIEKINGKTLYEIWYKIDEEEKNEIILKLVNILKEIHKEERESFDFIEYLSQTINVVDFDKNLKKDIIKLINTYFKENKFGLIHGDLHFDNIIYDGNKVSILDFERSTVAPIDYDFMILSRYDDEPYLWASTETDMITCSCDYQNIIYMILDKYEELNTIPYIKERIEIYSIIDLIKRYNDINDENIIEKVRNKIKNLFNKESNEKNIKNN